MKSNTVKTIANKIVGVGDIAVGAAKMAGGAALGIPTAYMASPGLDKPKETMASKMFQHGVSQVNEGVNKFKGRK